MDLNESYYSFQEYDSENEKLIKWREIHGNMFGKVFLSAFEDSPEAQNYLTVALIKISERSFNDGLSMLQMLEDLCFNDFDCFALYYFIGLCYEFLENEEEMNEYYKKMMEYDINYSFVIYFHPYYRTAKFAQRKSQNAKALSYYIKALELYSQKELDSEKLENMGQIYYDMATICLSCHDYEKSWDLIEKSQKCSPAENPERNYIMALLYAIEGKKDEAQKIVDSLPDYLKGNCEQLIAKI